MLLNKNNNSLVTFQTVHVHVSTCMTAHEHVLAANFRWMCLTKLTRTVYTVLLHVHVNVYYVTVSTHSVHVYRNVYAVYDMAAIWQTQSMYNVQ